MIVLSACTLALPALPVMAQSSQPACPKRGTQYTFSDGSQIEAVDSQPGNVCRFKNLRTSAVFQKLYGSFDPGSSIVKANLEKFQALAPLRVGQKVSFQSSGAGSRGADGIWFYDVAVEKAETVTTPAGSFPAVVILYDEQSPQFTSGRWQRRYWYSPQVGYAVKFEYQAIHGNPPPNYPRNWTLTEYKSTIAK